MGCNAQWHQWHLSVIVVFSFCLSFVHLFVLSIGLSINLSYCSKLYLLIDRVYLQLNVEKTKEMLIDFGRSTLSPGLTKINDIEITVIDNKLCFEANVLIVCNKFQQR